jgi:hypothetical protein
MYISHFPYSPVYEHPSDFRKFSIVQCITINISVQIPTTLRLCFQFRYMKSIQKSLIIREIQVKPQGDVFQQLRWMFLNKYYQEMTIFRKDLNIIFQYPYKSEHRINI